MYMLDMSMLMVFQECLKALIVAGANNDINVLDNSSLSDDLLDDIALTALYVVNGIGFENGYYLADGIYPQWETFVKSFPIVNDEKHSYFKRRHESARNDVERAFGVLQGRWGIIQQPACQYHVNKIRRIMFLALGWHLKEINLTWAHLEKKRTKLQLYAKYLEDPCMQSVETASPA
ncbi:ALP1-like protein [Tanacetum coccineum]